MINEIILFGYYGGGDGVGWELMGNYLPSGSRKLRRGEIFVSICK